jgi:hypothetical protein
MFAGYGNGNFSHEKVDFSCGGYFFVLTQVNTCWIGEILVDTPPGSSLSYAGDGVASG